MAGMLRSDANVVINDDGDGNRAHTPFSVSSLVPKLHWGAQGPSEGPRQPQSWGSAAEVSPEGHTHHLAPGSQAGLWDLGVEPFHGEPGSWGEGGYMQ